VLLVFMDLGIGGALARNARALSDPWDSVAALAPVDLDAYFEPSPAAAFLRDQMRDRPARYFGYAPYVDGQLLAYTVRFFDPRTGPLLVNNRAVTMGLQDVQGYDPMHVRRFDYYLAALNRTTQDYHNADVFPRGLKSPLLGMLNTRYI